MQLSVITPIFNEEEGLLELYKRLTRSIEPITKDYEIIFVNDGSSDSSPIIIDQIAANDTKVKFIHLSRNFGHQIAISAGLEHCKGDAAVIIDGDLQDPPELIPELYGKMQEGYEVVYAKRRIRKGESWFKKVTAHAFYQFMHKTASIDIPTEVGDFRIISRKIIECLKRMPEQNKFLRGQIAWMGFRQTAILYDREERKYGKTGYSLSKMINLAGDAVTSFSSKPLKWVTRFGFLVSFISFCLIIYALYRHVVIGKTIDGWTSIIVSTMFIGGVQILAIGVIGSYISRINKNVVDRPLYLIDKTNISIDSEYERAYRTSAKQRE